MAVARREGISFRELMVQAEGEFECPLEIQPRLLHLAVIRSDGLRGGELIGVQHLLRSGIGDLGEHGRSRHIGDARSTGAAQLSALVSCEEMRLVLPNW